VTCCVEQLSKHDVLAFALLVAVAAPVGGVPGTTQPDWHVAACELQIIMQFVVIEVCANRVFPANALLPGPTIASTAKKILTPRITGSHAVIVNAHDSALAASDERGCGH
jgi:hypothetical protein